MDSQHHKLYKSRRYTDDPTPATIFANLSFTMNDRDSFFRVSFVLIFMVNDPRHFFLNSARFTVSQAWRTTCWWSYAHMLITIPINDICFLHVLMKRKLPVDKNSKRGGRVGLFAKIVLACVAGVLRGRVVKRSKLVLVYPIGHVWYRVILDGGGRGRVNGDKKNMNFFLKSSAKLSKLLRPWRFSIKSFFTREGVTPL